MGERTRARNELLLKLQMVAWRSAMVRHRHERRIEMQNGNGGNNAVCDFASVFPSNIWLRRADNPRLKPQRAAQVVK